MQNDSQRRMFILLKFLMEQTDESHYISVADILQFWEAHGIHGNRKNVYSDIQLLMDFGVDVICIRNIQNRYFIGSRLLELPELKLLVTPWSPPTSSRRRKAPLSSRSWGTSPAGTMPRS